MIDKWTKAAARLTCSEGLERAQTRRCCRMRERQLPIAQLRNLTLQFLSDGRLHHREIISISSSNDRASWREANAKVGNTQLINVSLGYPEEVADPAACIRDLIFEI